MAHITPEPQRRQALKGHERDSDRPTRILVMALPAGRLIVDRVVGHGWSVTEAAMAAGVSDRTAYRWLRRFGEQGEAGEGPGRMEGLV